MNKKSKIIIISLSLIIILLAGIVLFAFLPKDDKKSENQISIQFSVNCSSLVESEIPNELINFIPKDYIIVKSKKYNVDGDSNLLKATKEILADDRITIDADSFGYVKAINFIYEKAFGAQSGWVYYINNVQVQLSAKSMILKDGDIVEWRYVIEIERF